MHVRVWSGAIRTFGACVLTVCLALPLAGAALAGSTATVLSDPKGRTVYSEPVTFSARVTGATPSGTVTFRDGDTPLATRTVSRLRSQDSLATGDGHTCAVTVAGGVQCWGLNNFGQLGDGTTNDRLTAGAVTGLAAGVVAVAAGDAHACALTATGAVRCWGNNSWGQLGDGSMTYRTAPVPVAGLSSGVVAISAGAIHTCALTATGAVKCWGYNGAGTLGDGTIATRTMPVQAVGLTSGIAAIAAGGAHTCALTADDGVLCWGHNNAGQVGDGTRVARFTPVQVVGLSTGVTAISTGEGHACALTKTGIMKCWGHNSAGQLGRGAGSGSCCEETPAPVVGLSAVPVEIAAFRYNSCAIAASGAAQCWGINGSGQLGNGTTNANFAVPVPQTVIAAGLIGIEGGYESTCALTAAAGLLCWGNNDYGQFGDGTIDESLTPVPVTGFGSGTVMIASGASFTTSKLDAGYHPISARYSGDGGNAPSTSATVVHVVSKAKTKTSVNAKPRKPRVGQLVRLPIQVKAVPPATAKPVGFAIVKDGRKKLGKVKVKNGRAGLRTRGLKAGKRRIKVLYTGDKNWVDSRASKTLVVRK